MSLSRRSGELCGIAPYLTVRWQAEFNTRATVRLPVNGSGARTFLSNATRILTCIQDAMGHSHPSPRPSPR